MMIILLSRRNTRELAAVEAGACHDGDIVRYYYHYYISAVMILLL